MLSTLNFMGCSSSLIHVERQQSLQTWDCRCSLVFGLLDGLAAGQSKIMHS